MSLDLETLGGGAGSGLITTVLTLLGWNKKIDQKQDKDMCAKIHELAQTNHNVVKEELKSFKEDVNKRFDKGDTMFEKINGKIDEILRITRTNGGKK